MCLYIFIIKKDRYYVFFIAIALIFLVLRCILLFFIILLFRYSTFVDDSACVHLFSTYPCSRPLILHRRFRSFSLMLFQGIGYHICIIKPQSIENICVYMTKINRILFNFTKDALLSHLYVR